MEMIYSNAIFTGIQAEVPKSRSIAFMLRLGQCNVFSAFLEIDLARHLEKSNTVGRSEL